MTPALKKIEKATAEIEKALGYVEDALIALNTKYDSMSDTWRETDKGEELYERIEQITEYRSHLEDLLNDFNSLV